TGVQTCALPICPAEDGRIPSPGRRGVRERGEAPPSRGKRAGGAPGPQGGGAEAPLSPAQRGDPGGRHGVPAVRDGAAPVSGVGRNGTPRSPGGPGPAFGSGDRKSVV